MRKIDSITLSTMNIIHTYLTVTEGKSIRNFTKHPRALDSLRPPRENYIPGLLGKDDEHPSLLVEDPLELLVQDHLTQLLLHLNSIRVIT